MPTFNSYKNQTGYYIRARLPDVGNVTYQMTESAEEFLMSLGYTDGDDLPRGLIRPLRNAEQVFTENSGVKQQSETIPTLNPAHLPKMSEDEIEELYEYLREHGQVPSEVIEKIKAKVDQKEDYSELENQLKQVSNLHDITDEDWEVDFEREGRKILISYYSSAPSSMCIDLSYYWNDRTEQYHLTTIRAIGRRYEDDIQLVETHKSHILQSLYDSIEIPNMSIAKADGFIDYEMKYFCNRCTSE